MAFGTAKSFQFNEVSLFQGVVIRGVPLCIDACKYALFI